MGQAWRPITDYETDPLVLEDRELRALSGVWIEQKSRIGDSPARDRFMQRLNREWAIETGLIERLYTLDRGVIELLIERGTDATLIPHRAAEDPEHVAALIVDQQGAIESVFSFVRGDRSLSTGYVKELHALFTRNQPFAEGRDHAGNRTRVPLVRGQGVLACSGTWFRHVQTEDGGSETEGETALSDVVFQINYREAPEEIESRFRDWLEGVVERGLALWESTVL